MASNRPLVYAAVTCLLALSTAACANWQRADPATREGTRPGADAGALSFQEDVDPILIERCNACHGAGGSAARSGFSMATNSTDTYASVSALVNADAPASSALLQAASGAGHMPILTADSSQYVTIETWIAQGAQP